MRRRDFIAGLGGAAAVGRAAWPLTARAQQPSRIRRIGMLMQGDESDAVEGSYRAVFVQGLQRLGWSDGANVRIDYRWAGAGDAQRYRTLAAELVGLRPDVIFGHGAPSLEALASATRSIPIVFAQAADLVAQRFVTSLARPSGNITGFITQPPSITGKMLDLLKDIAPQVTRVAFLYNSQTGSYAAAFIPDAEAAAAVHKVELIAAPVRDETELENALLKLTREPNGGLMTGHDDFTTTYRGRIIALAAKHRLAAIYGSKVFADDGGLISYGVDALDFFRQAAGYVDRILKGEKPAELPVQLPVKYELVVNLKTAKAIGLMIPETFLVLADRVIE